MRRAILLVSTLLFVISCHSSKRVVQIDPTHFDIPVVSSKIENTEVVTSPVVSVGAAPSPSVIVPQETLEQVITVPASTTPTVIKVYKKKVPLWKKVLTNEPTHRDIADNPNVIAEQPKKSVWKRWVILIAISIVLVTTIAYMIAKKFVSNFTLSGLIKSLISKIL